MTALLKTPGPKLSVKQGQIDLNHGAGGRATTQLIEQIFIQAFDNPWLAERSDQAILSLSCNKIAFSTDSYVITPIFFPGGNIGSLSVHGTLNDLAVGGATPRYLSASFILEEGFPLKDLQIIARSMAKAASQANVSIVTGDTKVVEKGQCDKVFINTTGIGVIENDTVLAERPQAGDCIIVNGYLGDHGTAIIAKRENLSFATEIISDTASCHELISQILYTTTGIRCMRDPTRGGLAAVMNEWAHTFQINFMLYEEKLPIRTGVMSACELLGLDPLYLANEGKFVLICHPNSADKVLKIMHQHPLGQNACIIGNVTDERNGFVQMETCMGGQRLVDWIAGEQLPRIC